VAAPPDDELIPFGREAGHGRPEINQRRERFLARGD
jgi:hypothetical protein